MLTIWLYSIISVFIVSLVSLIGVFTFSIDHKKLEKTLIYMVSLSAGTLLGDAFIHLIPEAFESGLDGHWVGIRVVAGIFFFFLVEKFFHWWHCHKVPSEDHPHPFSYVILSGDMVHNFIDGLIIAAGYLVSIPVGIATTIAVILHEIPQEIGDFGSLMYGGFSRTKALLFNFLSALSAIVGTVIVLILDTSISDMNDLLIPFAAGGFIYIASADLIPELHKNTETRKSLLQILSFIAGMVLMLLLLNLE